MQAKHTCSGDVKQRCETAATCDHSDLRMQRKESEDEGLAGTLT